MMSNSNTTTLDLSPVSPASSAEQSWATLALCWVADESGRAGEILEPGSAGVCGRQEGTLPWVRQRPGRTEVQGPLCSARLSREQLEIRPERLRLGLRNRGRRPLLVNGRPVDQVTLVPGDVVSIQGALLALCVLRPATMQALAEPMARVDFPFGGADEHGIVGESTVIWRLRERIAWLAARDAHVLVTGESGTGKELVARAIHERSVRGRRTLVSRNAATIPEALADAELFGNVRNYPNPGMADRPGLIGEADGSTLFLDELGELPQEVQAHLLRVLDHGEYQRLGETRIRRSDLRVIAATNRPPGQLKHDLLARFRHRVALPALRDRPEDLPLLVRHVLDGVGRRDPGALRRFGGIGARDTLSMVSAAFLEPLLRRSWVGNVRELDSLVWGALSESAGPLLQPVAGEEADPSPSAELTPAVVQACLDRHGGRQEPAWRELGLANRYVLGRLIRKYGLRAGRVEDAADP